MKIIEPCCAQRQVKELRNAIRNGGTAEFMGYGDLSLTELLPALLTRYAETELLIAAPSLPDQAAEVIGRWMRRQWSRADGQGKIDIVKHLTIIADLAKTKSPMANGWVKDNPFGDRLTLVDEEPEDTVILLPDLAITGPVNMRYGHEFTATATTKAEDVEALWKQYGVASVQNVGKAAEKTEGPEEKSEDAAVAQPDSETKAEEVKAEKLVKEAAPEKEESVKEETQKKEMPGPEAGQEEGAHADDQTMS